LLTLVLIAAGAACAVAALALVRARQAGRRAERVSESYWQLRYEIGQLQTRINRLESASGMRDADAELTDPRPSPTTTFVPHSSLKN
jgi:hypothetical protein